MFPTRSRAMLLLLPVRGSNFDLSLSDPQSPPLKNANESISLPGDVTIFTNSFIQQ